jgi:CheY-like chemotaxis protein
LEVQSRAGLRSVLADHGRLKRVLLNLCLNACDAMPRGGRLRVATDEVRVEPPATGGEPGRGQGTYARLTVEDTGEGMPEEVRARIFDPFFTTKQPAAGTGLGLAIVTGLVRELGGWVTCASARGRGTRFDVFLPVSEQIPGAAPPVAAATVLVVESEEPIRELARTILEKQGYRVVLAADGRQAIESFRRAGGKPALVVLDAHAPPAPGTGTLAELRALDPGVRVVLVNGLPSAASGGGVAKIQGELAKPFHPADLLAAVRAVLGAPPGQRGAEAGAQGSLHR